MNPGNAGRSALAGTDLPEQIRATTTQHVSALKGTGDRAACTTELDPELLRALRQDAELSQRALAELVPCSKAAVGHWETGIRFPGGAPGLRYRALLALLAAAFGGDR